MSDTARQARFRPSWQFSLRTLLLVMTVLCLVGGWWLNGAYRQRTAVRHFYALTAPRANLLGYEQLTTFGYRNQGKDEYYKPIVPEYLHWLRDMIGEDCFGEVTGVQLNHTAATNDDLRYLADLPHIERVSLPSTQVTGEGLIRMPGCRNLRGLQLDQLPISDEAIESLLRFPQLESLSLNGTQVTDAGLEHLAKLTRLKELWLHNTKITDDGYKRLQAALPHCTIQADVPSYWRSTHTLHW
jgi:hypothetical protein